MTRALMTAKFTRFRIMPLKLDTATIPSVRYNFTVPRKFKTMLDMPHSLELRGRNFVKKSIFGFHRKSVDTRF